MLDQLICLWRENEMNSRRLRSEIAIWMSQHCLSADDFAFSLACAMRDFVSPGGFYPEGL